MSLKSREPDASTVVFFYTLGVCSTKSPTRIANAPRGHNAIIVWRFLDVKFKR